MELIDRDNAVKKITALAETLHEPYKSHTIMTALYLQNEDEFPNIHIRPKTRTKAKWVENLKWQSEADIYAECSNCGWELYSPMNKTNYCPSCGCFMGIVE